MATAENMPYAGAVKNGVIVLSPDVHRPEGAKVEITLVPDAESIPQIDSIYEMAKLAVSTGIPDLGVNIDHYLYGHPKASAERP